MNPNIKKALIYHANVTAECVCYNWSKDLQLEEIKESYDRLQRVIKEENPNFLDMTEDELRDYGFIKWSQSSDLMCIPLYLMNSFREGTELICIDGTKVIVGKDHIDDDNRMGCIAYGIYPKGE